MKWPWSKEEVSLPEEKPKPTPLLPAAQNASKAAAQKQTGLAVTVSKVKVVLNKSESERFRNAEEVLQKRKEAISKKSAERVENLLKKITGDIEANSTQLTEIIKKPDDQTTIKEITGLLAKFDADRQVAVTQRDAEVKEAIEQATAAINKADQKAAARIDGLRAEMLELLAKRLSDGKTKLEAEIGNREDITKKAVETLVEQVGQQTEATFLQIVEDEGTELSEMAELYGSQIAILFTALASERMKSIQSASRIGEFDVVLPNQKPNAKEPKPKPQAETTSD